MYICYVAIFLFLQILFFFFFNDTATTEIYTLSLHDALPISGLAINFSSALFSVPPAIDECPCHISSRPGELRITFQDRKSTRLNSSHGYISYAVFCLKKKKKKKKNTIQ